MARTKRQNPTLEKLKRQADSFSSIVSELENQYREIVVGGFPEDKTIRIRFPNLQAEERINKLYSKEYGKMLSDSDMKTEEELINIMAERKVWTDADEDMLSKLREKVGFLSREILVEGKYNKAEIDDLCKQYDDTVAKLEKMSSKRYSITENSIEGRAQELKIKLQISECVFIVDKEGKETRMWETIDDINKESRRIMLNKVINEAIGFWNGVPSNFLGSLPEATNGEKDTQ